MSDLDSDFGFGMGETCAQWAMAEAAHEAREAVEADRVTFHSRLIELDSRIHAARFVL